MTSVTQDTGQPSERSAAKPQSLMLSFMGLYLRGQDLSVYTGSLIDVLGRVGVSEEAVRSTLSRMARRGLLERQRRGRKVYVGATPAAQEVLHEGHRRVWEAGAVNRDWDGTWTLVAFTMSDDRRSDRYGLRSRLLWAGFGPIRGGLWIAPGRPDVAAVVGEFPVDTRLTAFQGQVVPPTDVPGLVGSAFDIPAIAARYQSFLDRWSVHAPGADLPDDLARQLALHAEWLHLLRQDPLLPAVHLPSDWPAIPAERLFRRLARRWEKPVAAILAADLDTIRP